MSSSKDKLVIIGNGKIAKTLFHYMAQRFEVVCFAVEDSFILEEIIEGDVVDCSIEKAEKQNHARINQGINGLTG